MVFLFKEKLFDRLKAEVDIVWEKKEEESRSGCCVVKEEEEERFLKEMDGQNGTG